jgi:hypothetical protein
MSLFPSLLHRPGTDVQRRAQRSSPQSHVLPLFGITACLLFFLNPPSGEGQSVTPHELSPGVRPQPYDYFHPTRSGTFKVIVTPTNVWDQIAPASVAGLQRAGLLPVEADREEPDEYSGQILTDLAKRHYLDILIVGDSDGVAPGLADWFQRHGAASIDEIREPDLFRRSTALAEREFSAPRSVSFTTFNLLASHLAALDEGAAFPLRHETSLPLPYREYLEKNKTHIQRIYLVDVAQRISPSQDIYESYGSLVVPASVEEELNTYGIPVERITGEWEEDVSVALARKAESIYEQAVAEGHYEHLPLGWVPTSSLRSEWTNLGALIPFALAKQWFLMEYWADIHLQGREDTVEAYSDQYVQDFFLGMACLMPPPEEAADERPSAALHASFVPAADEKSCLIPQDFARLVSDHFSTASQSGCLSTPSQVAGETLPSVTAAQSTRRGHVLCTLYRWLAGYLKTTGIRDFILCEATGPYGENAAPMYNFEQVPGMILPWQMPDLYYRGWSGGGGLAGIDYDGSVAARKSCAVILLALERALYPPMPWEGEIDPAWPPLEIDHWEEAPRAICLTSDYEGWYANVFLTPRLIQFAKRKGVKFTLRPQGDISFCLPDYLRNQFEQGRGYIEFSNQGFLHEFDLIPFAPYPHGEFLADAVDRMKRFAGIQMRGFMPAGGFLSSTELKGFSHDLGLQYALCLTGRYIPNFDKFLDIQNRKEAPATGTSLISHFSQRPGFLAYFPTEEEDIQDNIAALEGFFQLYDQPPYAPYTAWHFVHGFQLPDEAAFRVLEAVVDYLKENWMESGEMVSVTLSDIASYFEEGASTFRSPVAPEPSLPPAQESEGEGGGCGSCSQLPLETSWPVAVNFAFEALLLTVFVCGCLRQQRSR